MEITGRIKLISETKTYGANGFRKRELVVTTEEQYSQPILIEFVQDKCDLLDAYQQGTLVKVSFNLRGREWINPEGETKYFNSIQGWRIENLQAQQHVATPGMTATPEPFETVSGTNTPNPTEEEQDDLPF